MKNITVSVPDDVYRVCTDPRRRARQLGQRDRYRVPAIPVGQWRRVRETRGAAATDPAPDRALRAPSIDGARRNPRSCSSLTRTSCSTRSRATRREAEGAPRERDPRAGDVGLSVQVLQEFYVQATRASRADAITHDQATGLVEAWRRFPVQDLTVEVMVAAFETRRRFGISLLGCRDHRGEPRTRLCGGPVRGSRCGHRLRRRPRREPVRRSVARVSRNQGGA